MYNSVTMSNTIVSIRLVAIALLFVTMCLCVPCPTENICEWMSWKSWGSCSRTCGGGTRTRSRLLCCQTEWLKTPGLCTTKCSKTNAGYFDAGHCADICNNGGHISQNTYRQCVCPDTFYGSCCESACPRINHCIKHTCTSGVNVECSECEGNLVFYKRTQNNTRCERTCSWNNQTCWPGTCVEDLTKNCLCASGFRRVSNGESETSCQLESTNAPIIKICETTFVSSGGDKRSTLRTSSSSACNYLTDVYGAFQPSTIQFDMSAEFTVDIASTPKSSFIFESKFGVTDTTIYIYKRLASGTNLHLGTRKLLVDSNNSTGVIGIASSEGNITLPSSTCNLTDGESVCVRYEVLGGGFLRTADIRSSSHTPSSPVPYQKTRTTRDLCYHYNSRITTKRFEENTSTREPLLGAMSTISWDTDCGVTKGCFPACQDGCEYLVTWQATNTSVAFVLQAKTSDIHVYLAIGFSADYRMGHDSVVACILPDGVTQARYNEGTESQTLTPPTTGLSFSSVRHTNGQITCSFTRDFTASDNRFFNLNNDYILMLVMGKVEQKGGHYEMGHHYMIPWSSDRKVDFNSNDTVGLYKLNSPLVKLHGIMMVWAWMLFSTFSILIARYNKDMFHQRKLFETKYWFQLHRACMLVVLTFDVIGFIVIFVEIEGYSQMTPPKSKSITSAHPVLGIIVTVLTILNPIGALFSPQIDHQYRWIFNWVHSGTGVITYILAVITLASGNVTERGMLPDSAIYVTVVHLLTVGCVIVTMEAHKFLSKSKNEIRMNSVSVSGRMTIEEPSSNNSPWVMLTLFETNAE